MFRPNTINYNIKLYIISFSPLWQFDEINNPHNLNVGARKKYYYGKYKLKYHKNKNVI